MPPRHRNPTILSNEYVEKTRALLEEYQTFPVFTFSSFWDIKYDEIIDFTALKYEGGLLGFLRDNHHLFELKRKKGGTLWVSLVSRPTSRDSSDLDVQLKENLSHDALGRAISKQRSIGRTMDRFFNKTNFLWADRPWIDLLKMKKVSIARSAFETAMDVNRVRTTNIITRIRDILGHYSLGLKITELYRYFDTTQLLKVFNCSISIVSLVDELPEVFYRKRTPVPEKDYIFDAVIRTIPDLTGHDDKIFEEGLEPKVIATRAINEGLYQKTLILIRETGVKGLKINVWMKSMINNFYVKKEDAFERDVRGMNVLTFFLALARYNLVELESHELIKNDIRAFLPRKYFEFDDIKIKLPNLNNLDCNSEEPDNKNEKPTHLSGKVTSNEQPLNKHVAETKPILKAKQN